MEFTAASDIGLARNRNEDSFTLLPLPHGALLAVADGVGGSPSGEVASAIATRTFTELLLPHQEERPTSLSVRAALQAAHERIVDARLERGHNGMGTTMTGAWLQGSLLAFAHAGDSRLYLYRGSELALITRDHSVAEELVRQGSIPPEDAQRHPHRHVLTKALGMSPFDCDEGVLDLAPGDVVLLCTDGLVAALTEAEVAHELARGFTGVAMRLVEAANRAGGPDNTTIVAARIDAADIGRGESR